MERKFFVLKLNPPRPTFSVDMNEQERAVMQQHVAYWMDLMAKDLVVAFGPVLDPAGAYGLGIISLNDETAIKPIIDNDPASSICKYDYYQMLAVVPEKK